jgi:hypothetical protein
MHGFDVLLVIKKKLHHWKLIQVGYLTRASSSMIKLVVGSKIWVQHFGIVTQFEFNV